LYGICGVSVYKRARAAWVEVLASALVQV